jgi:hypothetical protein
MCVPPSQEYALLAQPGADGAPSGVGVGAGAGDWAFSSQADPATTTAPPTSHPAI